MIRLTDRDIFSAWQPGDTYEDIAKRLSGLPLTPTLRIIHYAGSHRCEVYDSANWEPPDPLLRKDQEAAREKATVRPVPTVQPIWQAFHGD